MIDAGKTGFVSHCVIWSWIYG